MSNATAHTIRAADCRVEWFSGTGGGGQHRNKHANCCRVIHEPTGIRAQATSSKSRSTNYANALQVCMSRVVQSMQSQKPRYNATSERVRTYHAPDNRAVDHLSGKTTTYRSAVEDRRIGDLIEARKRAMMQAEAQQ